MNWVNNRPENWENPYERGASALGTREFITASIAFEASADAILEAVKEYIIGVGNEVGRDDLEFRIRIAAWICG